MAVFDDDEGYRSYERENSFSRTMDAYNPDLPAGGGPGTGSDIAEFAIVVGLICLVVWWLASYGDAHYGWHLTGWLRAEFNRL